MIPDELLFIIIDYIQDNNTCINLVLTCTYFRQIFYKYGYLKYLRITPLYNNPYNFMLQTSIHRKTLNTLCIMNINDAQHWIASWPKIVFFNYCKTGKIDPGYETNTENLTILNDRSSYLYINWKKFPKLKKFETTSLNFNHDDIPDSKSFFVKIN